VNRQYGIGNCKYAVILDPLLTGYVIRRMRSKLLATNINIIMLMLMAKLNGHPSQHRYRHVIKPPPKHAYGYIIIA